MKASDPSAQIVPGQSPAFRSSLRPVRWAHAGLIGVLAAILSIALLPATAYAQLGQLPCSTVGAPLLNDTQRAAVRDFVNTAISDVESDDHTTSQRGVRALLQPFACSAVSSDFRLEYSRALSDKLAAWSKGDDARRAWVAMLVAGRCSTDLIEGVLRDGLRDPRTAVRGAAAVGIRDAMVSLANGQEGLRADRGNQLAAQAFEQLSKETDPIVAEQLANIAGAFQQNPDLLLQHFAGLVNGVNGSIALARRSASSTSELVTPSADGLEDAASRDRLIILERTLDRVRVAMANPRVRDNLRNSDTAAAGLLAGQTLAFLRDELASGRVPADRTAAAERIIERAGEVLNLTGSRLGVSRPQAGMAQLNAAFKQSQEAGNADAFAAVADQWIGNGGGLVGGVFGGRAEAFAPVQ